MGNLSNGDHGQGKYCFSSLLRLNVNCYKAIQIFIYYVFMLSKELNSSC